MTNQSVQPSELHSNWRNFSNSEELQRLEVLDERIDRKKRSLDETISERQKIMNRSIRRMRRAQGKT